MADENAILDELVRTFDERHGQRLKLMSDDIFKRPTFLDLLKEMRWPKRKG